MAEQAQKEPTMEEILSSIRKIIADDDVATEAPARRPVAEDADFASASGGDLELDVFADLDAANVEDDFEPEMPKTTDDVLRAMQAKSADTFADDADSFAIEDHESDEMADIMEFIDFKRDPNAPVDPEPSVSEFDPGPDFAGVEDPEDSFEADYDANATSPDFNPEPEYIDTAEMPEAFDVSEPQQAETQNSLESEAILSTPLTDHNTASAAAGSLSKLLETVEFGDEAGGNKTIDGVVKELLRPMLKEWLDENLQGLVDSHVEAEIRRIGRRAG